MDIKQAWHNMTAAEAASALESNLEEGLTAEQVRRRREQFGTNELHEAPGRSFWRMLLDQFNQFLVLILIAAAIVSALIGWSEYNRTGEVTEFIDAIAIMTIVILNAILGVVQEGRAEEALAALKKMAAPNAHVLRDGYTQTIPSSELVPGDVVVLETGNYVPADVRLVESVNLRIEEASLTGESVPVGKDARDVLRARGRAG